MTTALTIGDLALRSDMVADSDWSRDVVAASVRLLEAGHPIVRDASGAMVVLASAPMRELSQNPEVGNAPVEFLTRRASERVRAASGVSVGEVEDNPFGRFLRYQLFTMNPPVHTEMRRVLTRQLMPRALLRFAQVARDTVRDILDQAADSGTVDFGPDIAARYTARFWSATLGMGVQRADEIQRLMAEMNYMFEFSPGPEDLLRVRSGTRRYLDLVRETVNDAWARGDNELLNGLATGLAAIDADGVPDDVGVLVGSNFFDAFHTVALALSNATYYLLSEPGVRHRVAAEPALAGTAFNEGVRLASPLMLTTRMALADVEYEGLSIPAGTPVTMVWAAGNRDPEAFDDPHRFRLDRGVKLATTFGGGTHLCPGRNAGKMLCEIALEVIAGPEFTVDLVGDSHEWVPDVGIRHLRHMPVRVRKAAS
jgi:cytochrome P450